MLTSFPRWWTLVLVSVVAACESPRIASPHATVSRASAAVTPYAPPTGGFLEFDVADPKGDNTGPIDIRDMNFVFDNVSGAFSITLQADPTAPFATGGSIRININLYNPAKSSYFHCNPTDFTLDAATQTVILVGSSSQITTWEAGDQVYTNSLKGTPNPPGTSLFRSQVVWNFDINSSTQLEDVIAYSNLAKPAKVARSKTSTLETQGLTCFTG